MRVARRLLVPLVVYVFGGLAAVPAQAQSDTAVFYVSPADYEIGVPITCPTYLLGGFTGFIFGYEHEGYAWSADWSRTRFVTATGDVADYVPRSGGPHLTSRDGQAMWYNAGVRVRCTAVHRYFLGRLISSDERYSVIANFGTVTRIDDGGGCVDREVTTFGSSSDEFTHPSDESATAPATCGSTGGSGTGDPIGEGSGTGAAGAHQGTFAARCESLGGRLYYDYVQLEQWSEDTGQYEVVWTGVAAICQT